MYFFMVSQPFIFTRYVTTLVSFFLLFLSFTATELSNTHDFPSPPSHPFVPPAHPISAINHPPGCFCACLLYNQ
ncbi:hypothetical protein F4703DRAFT_1823984 [Phycomyces blakesleeanus]